MYKYPDIVEHLRSQGNKKSAVILDKIFFSLNTEYLPCNWFIEAGAFEANASMTVKSKIPSCQVYAFEANPDNYNHFKENLGAINYVQTAVSNYVGNIVFKQQATGANGLIFPKVRGNNSLKSRTRDKETQYNDLVVPCTTLDDFFHDKINNTDIVGMWVDLEGAAYEAFTAATKILDQVSFLKVEVEDKQYWEDQKLSQDIIDFLSQHGMTPLIRDFEATSVLQYNILFCNNRLVTPELDVYLNGLDRWAIE
jgi:FkbM family methyltransferase